MKILIAEDGLASRHRLEDSLVEWGYNVIVAEEGLEAWELMQKELPDIAVLDWMMPGMDGVQLCQKIREKYNQNYMYIILLTSKTENDNIVAGFDAGADDYVAKPFNKEILRRRIAAGCRIVQYEDLLTQKNTKLEKYSAKMEELAQERSKQLVHAERMATVGLLSAGIAHEINNPTTFISGNVQILHKFWDDIRPLLYNHVQIPEDKQEKLEFIKEEMPKAINAIQTGAKRISKIVKGLKGFVYKNQQSEKISCNINTCIEQSLEFCENILGHHVTIQKRLYESLPEIKADPQQIQQIMVNLFTNAVDAIGDHDGVLTIETKANNDNIKITISDTGPGIPEDKFKDIWLPFYTTKAIGKGTGLGLFTIHWIIEEHKGQITVENKPAGGVLFEITLPVCEVTNNESTITDCR